MRGGEEGSWIAGCGVDVVDVDAGWWWLGLGEGGEWWRRFGGLGRHVGEG